MGVSEIVLPYLVKYNMSETAFSIEYKGTKEDAFNQMRDLEKKARQAYPQYDDCWEITWQDNGGLIDARYMGMDITGEFDIVERDATGGDVNVSLKLPVLLGMMKGKIESQLKAEIKRLRG